MSLLRRVCAQKASPEQRGFILPLTLWVIAAIGMIVVAVGDWVARATDNARILSESVEAQTVVSDIQNELIFIIGTRPMTYRGIEVGKLLNKIDQTDATALMTADYQSSSYINMDGRAYKIESNPDYILRLYDGRGMVSLNTVSAPYVRRLLALYNVPEQTQNSMVDALEDYTDRDDLTRISGAEQREYERLGRRPPANAWLMTPLEAQYVLGWDQVPELWKRDQEAPLLSTCIGAGFNPNTASREAILSTFSGLLDENVNNVLERRKERPFRNIREFAASADTLVRDEPFFFTFAPGPCTIVEVINPANGARVRFSLTIDNFSAKTKPWRIDYAFPIPAISETARREPPPEGVFPAPDTVDALERTDTEDGPPRPPRPMGSQQTNDPPPNL